jgi:multiple sugar transport system permease protein
MFAKTGTPLLLLLPSLAIVSLISFFPIYYAIDISLHETRFFQKGAFVGLGNYARLFHDQEFRSALRVSLKYGIGSLCLTLPLGMVYALLLNRRIRFRTFFRTVLVTPWALSQSATGMLWLWLLNPSYGPIKYLLDRAGITETVFLSNPSWALPLVIGVNTWMTYPLPTVLFLAALQTVPRELHESARIDGCSAWSTFWRVTLPFIQSTVLATAIILTLQFFNMVTLIYVMTAGGPLGTTTTLALRVFLDGFFTLRVSMAAAIGMIIFFLNIVFSLSYIRVLRQSESH